MNRATTSVVDAATRAAVATARKLPAGPERWVRAVHATVRALLHRLAAARGLPEPDLPYPFVPSAEEALHQIGPLDGWTPLDVGDLHQHFLLLRLDESASGLAAVRVSGPTARDTQGSWYTPQPLAQHTVRLGLDAALTVLEDAQDPEQVLRLRAVDPACGAGVLLLEGARTIAGEYARRLAGTEQPPPRLVTKVMPEVMYRCVFGMDIDPVAVDLTRMSLWLAANGRPPFTWLDGNIACINPLNGPNSLPPRLLGALGENAARTKHEQVV